MVGRCLSFVLLVLATLTNTSASGLNGQPQFTIKADNNKAFDESYFIKTIRIKDGNIADCLEHCLEDCRCQSFQICQNTKCQLCLSHKEENSALLHNNESCVYATYEIQHSDLSFQSFHCSGMSCYMSYDCCQVSGICPKKKICIPMPSLDQPWKRFTCECEEGYHGDDCRPMPPVSHGSGRQESVPGGSSQREPVEARGSVLGGGGNDEKTLPNLDK
ncbi:uncharacterized protein LOC114530768 [Dendronephthya gigantea]|uniref:uncharacterized protein LOC114530768 n=1 Tax=Dendronephthya gigantea TaxID=151771 RepID=UPI00106C2AD3|nr:uncharacterized protein LOC114530768 [Dendronephthya gigantea]